LKLYFDCII